MLSWIFLIFLIALILGGTLFAQLSPQFGGKASKEQKAAYQATGLYKDGQFQNQILTEMHVQFFKVMREFLRKDTTRRPAKALAVQKLDSAEIVSWKNDETKLIWFGHSTFLLNIDGKTILFDPMLGMSPSPVPYFGTKRFSDSLPINAEQLPPLDAVVISHDHYDHLDYKTILAIKDKVKLFIVPMGVDNHLIKWGVDSAKIKTVKWWDEMLIDSLQLVFAPSRHFTGRGVLDRNSTLWGSWIIKSKDKSIFFSGDGGYAPHFKEVGEKYGPFDLALIECGQYNVQWQAIHMLPEESVQAAVDVKAKVMMPVHWGAFTLALHSWTEPVERALVAAQQSNIEMITPEIGQIVIPDSVAAYQKKWWRGY